MIKIALVVLSLMVSFKIIADLIEISESRNVMLGILKDEHASGNKKYHIDCTMIDICNKTFFVSRWISPAWWVIVNERNSNLFK